MNGIRIERVIEITTVGKSTIWSWVAEGKFPKPIKLSARISIWDEDEIYKWLEEKR